MPHSDLGLSATRKQREGLVEMLQVKHMPIRITAIIVLHSLRCISSLRMAKVEACDSSQTQLKRKCTYNVESILLA